MARIIVSIAVSLVATVLGYLALWQGGDALLRAASGFTQRTPDPLALPLLIAGLVLLAIAMLSVALSSVGVIVVGAIHLLFGLLAVLIPSMPFIRLAAQAFGPVSPIGNGVLYSVSTGVGMLAGITFLVAGLAARTRRAQKPGGVGRFASVIVAAVAGPMGLLLALMGGATISTTVPATASTDLDLSGAVLVVFGAVLLGIAVLTLRWSSLGVGVLGVAVAVIGVIGILDLRQLISLTDQVSRDLTASARLAGPSGSLAMLGILLLAASVGILLRSRRWR